MTHAISGIIVQTVSSFLYVALGAWILTLTPRRLQTKLLAAFAILFGLTFATLDVAVIFHLLEAPSLAQQALQMPFGLLAFITGFGLAWAVPRPLDDRRVLAWALGIGAALTAIDFATEVAGGTFAQSVLDGAVTLGSAASGVLSWGASALLVLRARPRADGPSPTEVTQYAILAVAFASLGAFVSGMGVPRIARALIRSGSPLPVVEVAEGIGGWLVFGGLWMANMLRAGDETVRIHRAAALGILGLLAAGAIFQAAFPAVQPSANPMRGVMRTVGVGLLAYGILRHDLAGLDAKVEWTVSKTTVAGVFVAVFFVVSEGAQVLFAGFAQSELLGIVAAGALLFALSPIQRLADRVAAKAVPGGAEAGQDAVERYKAFVDMALADGEISREEARRLAERADELGLTNARARTLREQVEDEGTGGGDAP